ncbi:TPA: hypothetical protein ACH3X2_006466 [Trebouxia sp. C0005]
MQTSALMTKPVAVQSRIARPSSIRSFRAPSAPVAARRSFVVRAEDLGDKAKDAYKDAKSAVKDAAGSVKEGAKEAKDTVKGGAKDA